MTSPLIYALTTDSDLADTLRSAVNRLPYGVVVSFVDLIALDYSTHLVIVDACHPLANAALHSLSVVVGSRVLLLSDDPSELHLSMQSVAGWMLCPRSAGESWLSSSMQKQLADQFFAAKQVGFDSLTGLPNRALLLDRLGHEVYHARRSGEVVAVLFLDLDGFKQVNDLYGHRAGDSVLQKISKRLETTVRKSDTVARLGGDEFVGLLVNIGTSSDALIIAERMLVACSKPILIENNPCVLSVSIGISLFPEDGADSETLLAHADTAMYHAKNSGKNQVKFFSQEMNFQALHRAGMEAMMRSALSREEFRLVYQPQVDMRSNTVTGMEALLRWHSSGGLIVPDDFIPLAEQIGLIDQIGSWVLHTAADHLDRWQRDGVSVGKVAVNLSPRQFDGRLIGLVNDVLHDHRIKPSQLELEITESMVMKNPIEATKIMIELRKMGVSLAIDDFGTGFSSLASLRQFPVNTLKIDQSFIANLPSNEKDQQVTQVIIQLAKTLNMATVAEGVESNSHREILAKMGCESWQGYFCSRPLPMADVARFLADHKHLETH